MKITFAKSKRGFNSVDAKIEDIPESTLCALLKLLQENRLACPETKDLSVSLRVGAGFNPLAVPKLAKLSEDMSKTEKIEKEKATAVASPQA